MAKLHWETDQFEVWISRCVIRLRGFGPRAYDNGTDLSPEEFAAPAVEKAIIAHFSRQVFREVQAAVTQQAPIDRMNGACRITVVPPEIGFGSRDRWGGIGTSRSLKAFLAGEFNSDVLAHFGPTGLAEIAQTAQDILSETNRELPPATTSINRAMIVADFIDRPPDRLFTWEWGMNFEYNYSAQVYPDLIIWRLNMDEQWGGLTDYVPQAWKDFLARGAPEDHGLRDHLPDQIATELRDWLELEQATAPEAPSQP